MKKWCWMQVKDHNELSDDLRLLKKSGFTGVIIQGKPEIIEFAAKLGKKIDLEIHYWFVVMCCRDLEVINQHPDWFCISRDGKSTLTNPPYVDYYKWLCPNHPDVIPYFKRRMKVYLQMNDLTGIQLDYIRFPDVILPKKLQAKYNLVQNYEMPEFDFCYCPTCRAKYMQETGIDPLELKNPENDRTWLEFRLQSINSVVQELTAYVHQANKKITAAVFPTPEMSARMVRQRWSDWDIDGFFPMLYHNFYTGKVDWITDCLDEINSHLKKDIPIYAGLFMNNLNLENLQKIITENRSRCAGISLFDFRSTSESVIKMLEKPSK